MNEFKKGDRVEILVDKSAFGSLVTCKRGRVEGFGRYIGVKADTGIYYAIDKSNLRLITEKTYTKADLNTAMLFKLRDGRMAMGKIREDSSLNFHSKDQLDIYNGIINITDYNDDLTDADGKKHEHYDIIAIKQLKNQLDAYNAVKSNTEPTEWDWVRKDKTEPAKPADVSFYEMAEAIMNYKETTAYPVGGQGSIGLICGILTWCNDKGEGNPLTVCNYNTNRRYTFTKED